MKKLLLGATALGLAFGVTASANAQVKLELGGHFKGYGAYVNQDEGKRIPALAAPVVQPAVEGFDSRHFDILRETEIHFTGETNLDSGLTVGFHAEADLDHYRQDSDKITAEEVYAYFSGAWGRFNIGKEDSAAFLLQIAAPSADSNIDGIRQYINPVDYSIISQSGSAVKVGDSAYIASVKARSKTGFTDLYNGVVADTIAVLGAPAESNRRNVAVNTVLRSANVNHSIPTAGDYLVGAGAVGIALDNRYDYDQDMTHGSDKLTYLTPVWSGFQMGLSYTPRIEGAPRDVNGVRVRNHDEFGDAWEVAARYEGNWNVVSFAIGGAYGQAERHKSVLAPVFYIDNNADGAFDANDRIIAKQDDRESWNVGLDLNIGAFGIGGAYTVDDLGVTHQKLERQSIVGGIDYTTGPYKLGFSYYKNEQSFGRGSIDADRYTAGAQWSYGPGMTFRGSVSYIDLHNNVGLIKTTADATSVQIGTQIDF
jgi:outer membrane protein OmpU